MAPGMLERKSFVGDALMRDRARGQTAVAWVQRRALTFKLLDGSIKVLRKVKQR